MVMISAMLLFACSGALLLGIYRLCGGKRFQSGVYARGVVHAPFTALNEVAIVNQRSLI
jgi:hypothetical protein